MKKTICTALVLCAMALSQEPTARERELLERIAKLEQRMAAIEAQTAARPAPALATALARTAPSPSEVAPPTVAPRDTVNVVLDGYYSYNVNRPVGGVNLLRAYDVTSNSFNLNQAGVILVRAPNLNAGRRLGARLDLMFGQATETLQGGAQNEPRPQVFRNVFQAYGTYIAPVGKGLTVDFGKWASALGIENNYTKDQLNYTRSYFFDYLPFYHMGFRATYPLTGKLNLSYWLVNGHNQTEDFNGFKSQAVLLNGVPAKNLSWNFNYLNGREQRALAPALNPGLTALPTQPGLSITPVPGGTPRGRHHILDGYVTWNAGDKWTLAAEGDYVVARMAPHSPPLRVAGGAGYARYRFHPHFSLAGRFAWFDDSGGLFSGVSQTLKDTTLTATYDLADGFQMRWEYRRDSSNVPFFLTQNPDLRKREQNTALLGLIWWFGGKQGAW